VTDPDVNSASDSGSGSAPASGSASASGSGSGSGSDSGLRIERLRGGAIAPHLEQLAALRTSVFRAFPYLYEGTIDNERRYLATYASDERCLVVAAWDGGVMVGASTAMPAAVHGDEIAPSLQAGGLAPAETYYFGESVLDEAYRGRGLGHAFFDHREAVARELGFRWAAFCAVERAADHPARPADYSPLVSFWRKRGYTHHPEIRTVMHWRQVGDPVGAPDAAHTLSFWLRDLEGRA
jgi:GNAT superfamily N-acetyltransferase